MYFTEQAQQVCWEQYIWIPHLLRRVPSVGCKPDPSAALTYGTIDHRGRRRYESWGFLYSLKVLWFRRRENGMTATTRRKLCITKVKWSVLTLDGCQCKWTVYFRRRLLDLLPSPCVISSQLMTCFKVRVIWVTLSRNIIYHLLFYVFQWKCIKHLF